MFTGLQNETDVQVFDMVPVDYLDKMTDEKADLKTYCQQKALERIDSVSTVYLMQESRPYIKKYNLTQDKAQWNCWQVHIRLEEVDSAQQQKQESEAVQQAVAGELPPSTKVEVDSVYKNEKDIFVSACRRKYIPPLMECF